MLTEWFLVIGICTLGAMTPGASLAVVLRQALYNGRSAGVLTSVSHALGIGVYATISLLGIGILIVTTPSLFAVIKWGGAAYLLWLGINAWRNAGKAKVKLDGETSDLGNPVRQGLAIALINPKIILFFLALFSQVVSQQQAGHSLDWSIKALYAATAVVIDGGWYCLVAIVATKPKIRQKLLDGSLWLDRAMAGLLIAVALKVALG